jgi:hypothetical protein
LGYLKERETEHCSGMGSVELAHKKAPRSAIESGRSRDWKLVQPLDRIDQRMAEHSVHKTGLRTVMQMEVA